MTNIKGLLVLSFIYANGYGFLLPNRNLSTSQQAHASITNQDVIDVLNFVVKEVNQMRQDMSELKHNLTELMEETALLNTTMRSLKLENESLNDLKQEVADLKKQDVELSLQNAALTEKVMYNAVCLRNSSGLMGEMSQLNQTMINFKLENLALKQEVTNLGRKLAANKNTSVTFSATLPGTTSVTSSGIKFSTIISNIGGGYNGSDGVFYCPKDGLYLFSVTVQGYGATYAEAYFMKNTNQLALLYENGSGNSQQTTSLTLALNLRIGDRIWIKGVGIRYYQYSYFTGILVKQ